LLDTEILRSVKVGDAIKFKYYRGKWIVKKCIVVSIDVKSDIYSSTLKLFIWNLSDGNFISHWDTKAPTIVYDKYYEVKSIKIAT